MSSSDGRWAELSSQNERIIQAGELGRASRRIRPARLPGPQWAELASQSERLVGDADPLFRLASSRRGRTGHAPGHWCAPSAPRPAVRLAPWPGEQVLHVLDRLVDGYALLLAGLAGDYLDEPVG